MLVPVNTSIVPSIRYQLFSIFILLIISTILATILVSTIPSVSAISYLEQVKVNYDDYNDSLWSLGNGIAEGDYYSYKICNDDTIHQIIYPYHCYEISLEFVTILESYKGKVWVVQGNFSTPDVVTQQMIFLINIDTFEVYSDPLNVDLGNSIQNTIFLLSQYGVQSLSIGTVWDSIDSYFTNKIPLEIKNRQTIQIPHTSINGTIVTNIETSVLSYDIVVLSNTYLHNDFPFPLKAEMYSPNIIYPHPKEEYYFELLEYSREYSNYDSNYDSTYYSRDYSNYDSVYDSVYDSIEKYPFVLTEEIK